MSSRSGSGPTPTATGSASTDETLSRDLGERVRTSRLLGARADLVLHGGGNTSVKTLAREIDGEPIRVLAVKGSGSDLATIEANGFALCRLEPLRRMARLPALGDVEMVRGLKSQMLDPAGPTPSVEALLHAVLPGKFVDHTHADAALVVLDQPDANQLSREVWGPRVCFVRYTMPGFLLAQVVAKRESELAEAELMVLEKHGLFTWGETADESYQRMLEAVARAEAFVRDRLGEAVEAADSRPENAALAALRRRLTAVLRGAVARRAPERRGCVEWRSDSTGRALGRRPHARELLERGPATPDHVLRTKPWPLWLDVSERSDDAALRVEVERALSEYAARYERYFDEGRTARPSDVARLDALPRMVFVPTLGAAALGRDKRATKIASDVFAHGAAVALAAESIGRYTPVTPLDLFDVEYWSLEQAKLGKVETAPALAGRIALVTGAASGIGRATALLFVRKGAHVLLVDRDAQALEAATSELSAAGTATQVAIHVGDLLDPACAESAVDKVVDAFGGLDVLVSNAGATWDGFLHESDGGANLAQSLELNLLAHQRLVQAATPVLLRQGLGGCLLFNASKSAWNPGRAFGPYAVAKAALLALMRQYAIDLGAHGIRSNAVNADRVRTGLFSASLLEARAQARGVPVSDYFRDNLLRRETLASDVAEAFAWLATAEGTTGCVVTVDGGNAAAFPR